MLLFVSMKKVGVAILGGLFLASVTASAVAFRDIDSFSQPGGLPISTGTSLNFNFTLVNPGDGNSVTIRPGYADAGTTYTDIAGFRPGIDTITEASATFYIRSTWGDWTDRLNFDLDDLIFSDDHSFSVPLAFGEILVADVLFKLNSTGQIDYQITPIVGLPFLRLDYARLDVEATPGGVLAVADPGSTLVLLGCGVLAAAFFRQRKPGKSEWVKRAGFLR
jgi:hypothetical protein